MLNLKWLQSYVWNISQERFFVEDNRYVNKRLYKKLEDGKHDIPIKAIKKLKSLDKWT